MSLAVITHLHECLLEKKNTKSNKPLCVITKNDLLLIPLLPLPLPSKMIYFFIINRSTL